MQKIPQLSGRVVDCDNVAVLDRRRFLHIRDSVAGAFDTK